MTIEQTTDHSSSTGRAGPARHEEGRRHGWRPKRMTKALLAASAAGALAVGILIGGVGTALVGSDNEASLLLKPSAISSLEESSSPVAIAGRVAEIFGNKLIVEDGTGRALVETGPRGGFGAVAKQSETVTVQGRFDDGFLHAKVLVHEDGRVVDLGPQKPPFGPLKAEIARIAGR